MLVGKLRETMVSRLSVQSVLFCYLNFLGSFLVSLLFISQLSLPQVKAFRPLYHWQPAWTCCCLSTFPPIWDPFLYSFCWWCLLQITITEVHQITGTERHHHSRQAMDTKGTPTSMFTLGEGITSGEALSLRATFRMKSSCSTASPEALLSTCA